MDLWMLQRCDTGTEQNCALTDALVLTLAVGRLLVDPTYAK